MTDTSELLDLARRCRSLSARSDDDATVRSLDRLADDFEMRAKVIDYLANGPRLPPARRAQAPFLPVAAARAAQAGAVDAAVVPRH